MRDSREYPTRPICGIGVVVQQDDRVLIIQRGHAPRAGEWAIPGGGVELGETLQDAARREVREECGIEIKIGRVVDAVDIMQRDGSGRMQYHYIVVEVSARYVSGELRAASDVMDARWVEYRQLSAYPLSAKTREVVEKAFAVA